MSDALRMPRAFSCDFAMGRYASVNNPRRYKCDAGRNLKQSGTSDDDQARRASFLHCGDLPLGDAEQCVSIVLRGSVGADHNIRAGDDGGDRLCAT